MSFSDILFNYPNCVGYVRIILLLLFLAFDKIELYMLSYLLDALDGYLARKYNQCTTFGGVLDMIVDRISSSVILLTKLYSPMNLFYVLLDWSSHFIHMQASLLNHSKSHKSMDYGSKILHMYYFNRTVLFSVCFGYELYNILEYMDRSFGFVYFCAACIFYFKNILHGIQLCYALKAILMIDVEAAKVKK